MVDADEVPEPIAYVRVGGDGRHEMYACGKCGLVQSVKFHQADPEKARQAAMDCPACRETGERLRVMQHDEAIRRKREKATVVTDIGECFSEDGERFYYSPEDAREAGETGVFGASYRTFEADASAILQGILEGHHEDSSRADLVDCDRLLAAIEEFNKVQTGGTYDMDDNEWQAIRHDETFGMIKPDATTRGVEDAMIADIGEAGFEVVDMRRCVLERRQAEWLYREHKARAHFSDLVDYTISGEVVLLRLKADDDNAPIRFRTLMGATDREKAEPGTLRAKYAVGYRENSVHGSDSPAAAGEEIEYFFGK